MSYFPNCLSLCCVSLFKTFQNSPKYVAYRDMLWYFNLAAWSTRLAHGLLYTINRKIYIFFKERLCLSKALLTDLTEGAVPTVHLRLPPLWKDLLLWEGTGLPWHLPWFRILFTQRRYGPITDTRLRIRMWRLPQTNFTPWA